MGIHQSDAILREAVLLGLADMKANPWLIDYVLQDFTSNPYLKDKYGAAQVEAAKEWILNNNVDVYMGYAIDKAKYPCIAISLGASNEKPDMKHLADLSTESSMLLPNQIGKPVGYIVKPFTPTSYDSGTGFVGIAADTSGLDNISPGMILVNPASGEGYIIQDVGADGVLVEAGIHIEATQLAVVPQYQYYTAKVEHAFFQETYHIGLYVHGDPQSLLWLHSIVLYCLFRYKESLLEANGVAESVISSTDFGPAQNNVDGGDQIWSRFINITSQVESSWIKSPKRTIETVSLKEKAVTGYKGGIKILSNLNTPSFINEDEEIWRTIEES